jgi:hypothetical protein
MLIDVKNEEWPQFTPSGQIFVPNEREFLFLDLPDHFGPTLGRDALGPKNGNRMLKPGRNLDSNLRSTSGRGSKERPPGIESRAGYSALRAFQGFRRSWIFSWRAPRANEYSGMGPVTTDPAPTTLLFPIVTPSKTMAPAPSQTSSPIWIPPLESDGWNMMGVETSRKL